MKHDLRLTALVLSIGACLAAPALAQTVPWQVFQDDVTGELCGVVNAGNAELVVLADTGQLVIVGSGGQDVADVLLVDILVSVDGSVTTTFGSAGFIQFATDADGFGSLFWLDLTGRVFDVNGFTGEPVLTDRLPGEFIDVPCDACEFWDGAEACVVVIDEDRDGVPDDVDDCPDTPGDELADAGGCSCSQLDDDGDTIDNCFDLCTNTPNVVNVVDEHGCACFEIDSDGDGVDDCNDLCTGTLAGILVDADGCSIIGLPPTIVVGMCGNFIGAPLMIMFMGLGFVRFSRSRDCRSVRL